MTLKTTDNLDTTTPASLSLLSLNPTIDLNRSTPPVNATQATASIGNNHHTYKTYCLASKRKLAAIKNTIVAEPDKKQDMLTELKNLHKRVKADDASFFGGGELAGGALDSHVSNTLRNLERSLTRSTTPLAYLNLRD